MGWSAFWKKKGDFANDIADALELVGRILNFALQVRVFLDVAAGFCRAAGIFFYLCADKKRFWYDKESKHATDKDGPDPMDKDPVSPSPMTPSSLSLPTEKEASSDALPDKEILGREQAPQRSTLAEEFESRLEDSAMRRANDRVVEAKLTEMLAAETERGVENAAELQLRINRLRERMKEKSLRRRAQASRRAQTRSDT